MKILYKGNYIDSIHEELIPVHAGIKQEIIISEIAGVLNVKTYNGTTLLRTIAVPYRSGYPLTIDLSVFASLLPVIDYRQPYSIQEILISDGVDSYSFMVNHQMANNYVRVVEGGTRRLHNETAGREIFGGKSGKTISIVKHKLTGGTESITYKVGTGQNVIVIDASKLVVDGVEVNYERVCGLLVRWQNRYGGSDQHCFESFKMQEQYVSLSSVNAIDEMLIQLDEVVRPDQQEFFNFLCKSPTIEVLNESTGEWLEAKCTNKAGSVFTNNQQTMKFSITLSLKKWN